MYPAFITGLPMCIWLYSLYCLGGWVWPASLLLMGEYLVLRPMAAEPLLLLLLALLLFNVLDAEADTF
jgi:hypothetical protein